MPILQFGVFEYSRHQVWSKDPDQFGERYAVTHRLFELYNGRNRLGNGFFNPPSERLTDVMNRFKAAYSFASPI